MRKRDEHQLEHTKFFVGYLMAEIWNSAGKSLKSGVVKKPMDFWVSEDRQADVIEIQELMNNPELKGRFKGKRKRNG